MPKPILFIDWDDTVIARINVEGPFEMRPVIGLINELTEEFDVRWLTCCSDIQVGQTLKDLYGYFLWKKTTYEDWPVAECKAVQVLKYKDWWWLEDGLTGEDIKLINDAGLMDRYIHVSSTGLMAFHDAVNELRRRVANVRRASNT